VEEQNLPGNPPESPTATVGQTAPDSPSSEPDIDVDLSADLDQTGVSTEKIQTKENYARWIAIYIVAIFGVSLCLLILLGFVLLIWLRWAPDKADVIFNKAVIPFVEKIGTFATTVFGPLLAFILGYYFGEKNQNSHDNAKSG
jgi:hypothetical protein